MNNLRKKSKKSKWTLESCQLDAKKYKTRSDWQSNSGSAYQTASQKGWLVDCCMHMEYGNIIWTKENCINSAKQHKTRTSWFNAEASAYNAAKSCGWFEECVKHMPKYAKSRSYTLEECKTIAAQYDTISKWKKGNKPSFEAAEEGKWIDECTPHIDKNPKWTLEKCINSALPFNSRSQWYKNQSAAYQAARRRGWLNFCSIHMQQ